ncbi:MAG TPA: PadR family transcriptional regulator [Bacillales bacterium]
MPKENKSLFALLGILSLGPHSGYEVKKTIESSLIHFWREGYGQIYPNLKTLVDRGWATMQPEKQHGKPDRNVYAISEKGKQALQRWLGKPIEAVPVAKNELLLKLFFGDNISVKDNIAHLQRYKKNEGERLKIYNGIEQILRSETCQDKNKEYALLTLRFGKKVTQSVIEWCDESISVLENLKKNEGKREDGEKQY